MGCWFDENLVRAVGNATKNFFWLDPWLEGDPLCSRFKHLFVLAKNQFIYVTKMNSIG